MSLVSLRSRLVSPAIAETTTTTSWPSLRAASARRATLRMRSASATDVPPYFCTMSIGRTLSWTEARMDKWCRSASCASFFRATGSPSNRWAPWRLEGPASSSPRKLAGGYSGIRETTLDLLVDMRQRDVIPVVPEKGSVGASGDLAPLAHLALVLIGEGEAFAGGQRLPGREALARAGLT